MRVIGFTEIAVKIGAVVIAGKDLYKCVVMDAVGIGEKENTVFFADTLQPIQPFGRKIEQQGVPGGFDLLIGQTTAGFAAKSIVKFQFAHLAGFQLLKQVVGMVLGKHAGELGDAEIDESLFGKTKIQVHKNATQVENDVFCQFENLRMREFENPDLIIVKGYPAANIQASKGLIFKFSNFQIRFYWSFLYFCRLVEQSIVHRAYSSVG